MEIILYKYIIGIFHSRIVIVNLISNSFSKSFNYNNNMVMAKCKCHVNLSYILNIEQFGKSFLLWIVN